jgi:roadblock/LC7 domain-containing protein
LKKILLVLLFVSCSNLNAQVWQEYTIATGITNNINFTSTSNLNSNYTPGNRGIFFDNASADTNRTFFPLDIVNDANAYPFRTTVRIGNVTEY